MAIIHLDKTTFLTRVKFSEHGARITYHVGNLYVDRQCGAATETLHSPAINAVAHAAWDAMEKGHVRLIQRKLRDGIYEYIAEKLVPARPVEWEGCYHPDNGSYIKPKPRGMDRNVERKRANARPPNRGTVREAA